MASIGLSVIALAAGAGVAGAKVVPPTKRGGLYFSEHNWAMETSSDGAPKAVSVNAGAYIKAAFSGSARASFALEATEPSSPESEAPSTHYMNVVYSIDNKPWVEVP
jgi:hypothetical protein